MRVRLCDGRGGVVVIAEVPLVTQAVAALVGLLCAARWLIVDWFDRGR